MNGTCHSEKDKGKAEKKTYEFFHSIAQPVRHLISCQCMKWFRAMLCEATLRIAEGTRCSRVCETEWEIDSGLVATKNGMGYSSGVAYAVHCLEFDMACH